MKKLISRIYIFYFIMAYNSYVLSSVKDYDNNLKFKSITKENKLNNFDKKIFYIYSKKSEFLYPSDFLFSGNVKIYQGNYFFSSDYIKINLRNKKKFIFANGNVIYSFKKKFVVKGEKALFFINTKDVEIYNIDYNFFNNSFAGKADSFKGINNGNFVILKNGSLNLCSKKCNTWNITGSKIIYDRKNEIIKIWNAKLNFKNIPIFYVPFFKVYEKYNDIFYSPKISYKNNNGLSLSFYYKKIFFDKYFFYFIPKYNSDGTILLNNKIYYSSDFDKKKINLYILFDIKKNKNNWFIDLKQNYFFNKKLDILYIYKKSNNFIIFNKMFDIEKNFLQNEILEKFNLKYFYNNWKLKLEYKKFIIFDNKNFNYIKFPHVYFSYFDNKNKNFKFNFVGKFSYEEDKKILHINIEPFLSFLFLNPRLSIYNEIKFIMTNYYKYNNSFYNIKYKYFPQINSSINFYNYIIPFKNFFQVFELNAKYIFSPFLHEKENEISNYYFIKMDYFGLFREKFYNKIGYIYPKNQLAIKFTNYIYRKNYNDELLKVSFGKIFYSSLYFKENNHLIFKNWYLISNLSINDRLKFNNNFQICDNLKKILKFNINLIYNNDYQKYHIKYYFIDKNLMKNINHEKSISNDINNKNISLFRLFFNTKIKNNFYIFAYSNYNVTYHKYFYNSIGIEYNSCCLNYKISYERNLNPSNVNYVNNNKQFLFSISFNQDVNKFYDKN
ncbi:imp [Wigglesworthia glossinidia endosymbiont of Glossina brevipalpis]|uniref:Imp protein n=1 Tax=Wigglesworthia glossinidia brevipalpis TaxID=36870 RepID=Q8D3I4_WIGBR|nr:imp [Wigglesworthia glossinidia endosymbiont of Glossina brevipalpis]